MLNIKELHNRWGGIMKKRLIFGGILWVLIIAIIAVVVGIYLLKNTNTKDFPITGLNLKTCSVQEPYQTQQQVQVNLQYTISDAHYSGGLSGLNWMTTGYVSIYNADTEPGTFIVDCNFRTLERTFTPQTRVYALPGETKTASCEADTNLGEDVEFTYIVTPGQKTITQTVTQYRTVEKPC